LFQLVHSTVAVFDWSLTRTTLVALFLSVELLNHTLRQFALQCHQ